MAETMSQMIAGIYARLRRPSEQQLPYEDVRMVVLDTLRGYVQDMTLNERNQLTETQAVTLTPEDVDYSLSLPGVPDFEPVRLEYGTWAGNNQYWSEVLIVPPSEWTTHFGGTRMTASFYGSSLVPGGLKVRLNASDLSPYSFRFTYRPSLLAQVQAGSKPPIPSNHLPMVTHKAAIEAATLVDNDTKEWVAWLTRTLPVWSGLLLKDEERWRDYLSTSIEPAIQPIPRFDAHRGRSRRNPRAYLPIGGN
jgi:hypothetical protein